MPQDELEGLRVRRVGDARIVAFFNPYLQTEDVTSKVGAKLFKLIEGKEPPKLVLSFDGVRFVSSSMLAEVIKLHKAVTKAKGRLGVCSLAPNVREVLRASQLDRLLEVYDDEAAALAKIS